MIAYWHLSETGNHTGLAEEAKFKTPKFDRFVTNGMFHWYQIIEDWVLHSDNRHFVMFEVEIYRVNSYQIKSIIIEKGIQRRNYISLFYRNT